MNIIKTYYLITFMSIASFYLNAMSNWSETYDPVEAFDKLDKEIEKIKNPRIKQFARAYFECDSKLIIHLTIYLISMIPIVHLLLFAFNFIELLSHNKKED